MALGGDRGLGEALSRPLDLPQEPEEPVPHLGSAAVAAAGLDGPGCV